MGLAAPGKRAMRFKIYLTNPSMRAALFGQVDSDAETMGNLTETAIFSQWQHSDSVELYYARGNSGEIDIVSLSSAHQPPEWIVEVKWSDRPQEDRSLLRHCVEFAQLHSHIQRPILVTTKTVAMDIEYRDVEFRLQPSSLYAYALGANILSYKTRRRVEIEIAPASDES